MINSGIIRRMCGAETEIGMIIVKLTLRWSQHKINLRIRRAATLCCAISTVYLYARFHMRGEQISEGNWHWLRVPPLISVHDMIYFVAITTILLLTASVA